MKALGSNESGPAVVFLRAKRAGQPAPAVWVRHCQFCGWTIVEVTGEMDLQTAPLLADRISDGANRVAFDLHAVTFIDASGLGMLMGYQRRALEHGGCLRLVAPSAPVRRLLALTGCDHELVAFESLSDILAGVVGPRPEPSS